MTDGQPDSHRITRLGPYVIHRVLGEGGMGIVYDAHDPRTQTRVALKCLHSSLTRNETARARFEAEMRILETLVHPNIVKSLGSAWLDGRLVLVLEYLEGRTIRDILRTEGAIPAGRAVPIARQIALALVFAHVRANPVVHRDIKPENIMVLGDGVAKVMDFGVAKVLKEMDAASLATKQVGTVRYMSPEQADAKAITTKTDCYALGLLLYEMLTGRVPFDGDSLMSLLRQHCEAPPPPFLASLRNAIPRELEELVFALLEKQPERRPDAATAEAALRRIGTAAEPATRTLFAASSAVPVGTAAPVDAAPAPEPAPEQRATELVHLRVDAPVARTDVVLPISSKRRARWPLIAVAAAVPIVAGGTALAVFWPSASPSSAKRSARPSASARPAPPPSASDTAPTATAQPPRICGAQVCAPFAPPDPTNVDESLLVASAREVARKLAPDAELSGEMVFGAMRGHHLDVTRPRAIVSLQFSGREVDVVVVVKPTELMGSATPGKRGSAISAYCPLARAIEAVTSAGGVVDDGTNVSLYTLEQHPTWLFTASAGGTDARVEDASCRVANVRKL
ncbi:MAG: protein kinase [Polyangiaceae bacterium]